MAVKYACTKCDKRFVDWGAEKIKSGEGCPDCKGEFLELMGFDAARSAVKKKPALKRKPRAARAAARPANTTAPDAAEPKPDAENGDAKGAEASAKDGKKPKGRAPKKPKSKA